MGKFERLNYIQVGILESLFNHAYFNTHQQQTCTHNEQKVKFGPLLEMADREGIPWLLQNLAAGAAEKRENGERYFRSDILPEILKSCEHIYGSIVIE